MDVLYLIKLGEIQLKEDNRFVFEARLKRNIEYKLRGVPCDVKTRNGRYYVRVNADAAPLAEKALSTTPGINGWARAEQCEKNIAAVTSAALSVLRKRLGAMSNTPVTFKVEARRSDKSFPLDSYGIACTVADAALHEFPELCVNVRSPDITLNVEIRERAYIYADGNTAPRGLPVGTSGAGLLLLSGGIDSPVAGYRMLTRGLALEALYFHAWPYTSQEAHDKVKSLAAVLASYSGKIILHTAHFTDVQLAIKKSAPDEKTTLYLRAAMMLAADAVARRGKLSAIVSGESLGQVASQTAENMRFTGSFTDYPVLRPLAGTDKEDIIRCARAIGTYDISILPYEDCCVLFSPKHPVLRADFYNEKKQFDALGLSELIQFAVDHIESETLYGYGNPNG